MADFREVPPHIHNTVDIVGLQNLLIYRPFSFFFSAPPPNASEPLAIFSICQSITFLENFGGSTSHVGTAPASAFILTIQKNGSSVGTATIDTLGNVTFASLNGNPVDFAPGDWMSIYAPPGTDGVIANVAITLRSQIQ